MSPNYSTLYERYIISVRLMSNTPEATTFKGFLIQARNEGDLGTVVGMFNTDVSGTLSRNCQGKTNVSHY